VGRLASNPPASTATPRLPSVDNSSATGIGKRLDGWANTDLNVGAIIALSPALDEATKAEFRTALPCPS
jgi:hypothetical protein